MSDLKNKNEIDIKSLNLPYDLKRLSLEQCEYLTDEIRDILVSTISKNGGHLASNLGAVEITMAIHRIFDSPKDKIIWDVGHQCYTHKILTGRLDKFNTIRTENGLSGFPKPDESEHDIFISGHSSTSISVACGISDAMRLNGDREHYVIVVIGDGAMTGGLAYEGLNNAGKTRRNMIIILNDNEMSISKNVGALSQYLRKIRTNEGYVKAKQHLERRLLRIPKIGLKLAKGLKAVKDCTKKIFIGKDTTLFENMGFVYLGPVDGNDLRSMENALKAAKTYHCPVIIHANTTKGKGYTPAEENPGEYHGVSKFDIMTGNPEVSATDSFSTVFGKYIVELADNDKRICAITAAMKYGTGLQYFAKKYPRRFFDVGIAEQHAVTFAAGLASQGMIPIFAVYSSFLQRAYDQLIHDVSIGNNHVVIGIDRAGIVGLDGETHQGMFDISLLTSIPNTTIYSPSTYEELKMCVKTAVYDDKHLACVRYPRGNENINNDKIFQMQSIDYVYTENNNSEKSILLISYGRICDNVLSAMEILSENNIEPDFIKLTKIFPFSENIVKIALNYKHIIMCEESYIYSGIGNMIAEKLSENQFNGNFHIIAANDFLKQASVSSITDKIGLSPEKIAEYAKKVLKDE